jgi:phage gp36-like protein
MARFLKDEDYTSLIRNEIKDILTENHEDDADLLRSEDMAIAQIRNYLFGRYDVDKIFASVHEGEADTRNAHIVMIAIDITIYHLYTAEAPGKISQLRETRYQDTLNWLKEVTQANGDRRADLPLVKSETGEEKVGFRLKSRPRTNNRY